MKPTQNLLCVTKGPLSNVAGKLKKMCLLAATLGMMGATNAQQNPTEPGKVVPGDLIIKPVTKLPEAPLFFKANIEQTVRVDKTTLIQVAELKIQRLQGKDNKLSLAMSHRPEKIEVLGTNGSLKDWAIRKVGEQYFLDLTATDPNYKSLALVIKMSSDWKKGAISVVTFGADPKLGNIGFQEKVTVMSDPVMNLKVLEAEGFLQMQTNSNKYHVLLSNKLTKLKISAEMHFHKDIDLRNIALKAKLDSDGKSAVVSLTGDLHVRKASDAKFLLLKGRIALTKTPELGEAKLHISQEKNDILYELIAEREGTFPVNMEFAVPVTDAAGWNTLHFSLPNGAVVPVEIGGFKQAVDFYNDRGASIILHSTDDPSLWQGVLPANGLCMLQWKNKRKTGDGELFFTSEGNSEIKIGAGLMETIEHLKFKILQGKMKSLTFDLEGEGEVLSVTGNYIASWKVNSTDGKRTLTCVFNSARSSIGDIRISTQSPLGKFPAKVKPLTITPQGAMRHSGYVKVSNKGAVRIEASKTDGLMQLAPNQYPASAAERKEMEKARQLFIYRYPSAERQLEVLADQITPEVAVSHITVYGLGETDRVIYSDIEIEIREAGLREWTFKIPSDYAVSAVQSANMADHVVSTTAENGMRSLKIIFNAEVIGRQLIRVRLEKNSAAQKGEWALPKFRFLGALSVRGEIGVQAEHGWRVTTKSTKGLTDRALAYFPKRSAKLQQAYRTRSDDWNATVTIAAMGQSVQADLFHLYNLKESMLEAKILVNYFVIGAPASKWELLIPESAENVSVEGQNVLNWEVEKGILKVNLQQPALGSSTLLITYEEGMQASGGDIELGGVAPMDVQSESGFIHLVSNSQVQSKSLEQTKGLHSISPLEMPSSFQVLSSQPSVAAWQYAARPYTLKLNVKTPELIDTIDQVVGAATLDTKITSAGEVVTRARFLVNTRGKKALRITLPKGNQLWSAKSDHVLINARVDGDQYILPLPPTNDPNRYRTVEIRYGGISDNPEKVVVGPPVLSAPMTIAEWKVSGDNHLIPTGGNVKPLQTVVQKSGFDWMRENMNLLIGVVVMILGGLFLTSRKFSNKWLQLFGVVWLLGAAICSMVFANDAMDFSVKTLTEFDVVAPVVGNQEAVLLELDNLVEGVSPVSSLGVILMLVGLGVFIGSFLKMLPSWLKMIGLAVLCIGALFHVGGGCFLFSILATIAMVLLILALKKTDWSQWRPTKKAVTKKASATAAIALSLCALSASTERSHADEIMADKISEQWQITDETMSATMRVEWTAKKGEAISILSQPATLTGNIGAGYRVIKQRDPRSRLWTWKLVAEADGNHTATISYEMPMKGLVDRQWTIPSGKAAMKTMTVEIDQANWTVSSTSAIRSKFVEGLADKSSVELSLIGIAPGTLSIRPKPRDRKNEKLRFFAETTEIYMPAAGVLDGRHQLKVRPLSGQVEELVINIPSGLLVGDVLSPVVDSWRFNAKQKTLTITMQSPQVREFAVMIVTQKGIKAFPQDLLLEPIKVRNAENVVGLLGYGFGAESQPDNDKVAGLLEVNIADFDLGLLKEAKKIQPSFVLHKAYRYGNDGGNIKLRVAAVAPEIRVQSQQQIRLTDERVSLQVEALVNITRAGVFELKFEVPLGLTVESVNGPALRDWSEVELKGKRVVTMFLNGKTIGQQRFAIAMQGETNEHILTKKHSNPNVNWMVPRWSMMGVERQKGTMTIVPDHGIRLRVIERKNASQINSRAQNNSNKNALQFRLLQNDWVLGLNVQKLDAWITAELLQEVTLKESITKKRVSIVYHVENSVVKSFRVSLPNVLAENSQTVRASGPSVKEIVHIEGDVWEVKMKQAVIGKVPVTIAYEDASPRKDNLESIAPVKLLDSEQVTHYVAARAPGRLDIQLKDSALQQGWRVFDWAGVPQYLHNIADRGVPGLCYRVSDTEKSIAVSVKRHAMAGTLKLRVEQGEMRTLLNSDGSSLSRLSLQVRVIEESSLKVMLPKGAELFNVIVNDESVAVVRDGDEYRFIVAEASQENAASQVKITYRIQGSSAGSNMKLLGPSLNVPLEKINWFVMLPDGYDFSVSKHGGFDYKDLLELGSQNYVKNYVGNVRLRYQRLRLKGQKELEQAMAWSSQGQLDKANGAFNRVYNNAAVDAASNEDARVKLERNMTSQAIMGLNTRRQQMYLDNKKAGNAVQSNIALEKAATENPFFAGKQNFDPNQLSNYMQGNTQEEINAMSRIAKKLVANQLDIPQAMQAIDIELLDTSRVLHFYRDIQLTGDNHPAIELSLEQATVKQDGSNLPIILIISIAAIAGGVMMKGSRKLAA